LFPETQKGLNRRMVNKIAFFNGKGGCGKTTSIYHVAGVLAKRGEKTLVIDFDKQRNLSNSMFMYGEPPKSTIYDFMTATGNVLVAAGEAMFKKHGNSKPQYFGVDCMPGDIRLEDEKMLKRIKAEKFGARLNGLIEGKGYKWVLVDMPPSNKALNDICFSFVVDFVIVPFSSDLFSISGYDDLMGMVTKAR
jgi:chromosome partitioning protein